MKVANVASCLKLPKLDFAYKNLYTQEDAFVNGIYQ